MANTDIKKQNDFINQKHIDFYNKTLEILSFILEEYSRELTRADIDFLEMPKNAYKFSYSTRIPQVNVNSQLIKEYRSHYTDCY